MSKRTGNVVAINTDVSIVMPCLNEERTLARCIEWAQEALETMREQWGLAGEVVIADNGSTDASIEIAEQMGARVVHVHEKGYGAALRGGILGAGGRFIIMADSDQSYDFREGVPMVGKLLEGYDLCMGTRLKGTIKPGAMPWKNRHIGNPALSGILNILFRSGLSDAHCGLRAFTKEAFLQINPTSPGMEFASEIVVKAALLNLKRTELPATLSPDGRDRPPHLNPWRDGWRHLRYLFMLSPTWTFFGPGVALLAFGALVLAALLSVPPGEQFRLGPLSLGDHWAILAGVSLLLGQQAVFAGITATKLGVREGYRRAAPVLLWLSRKNRFDHYLMGAGVLIATGLLVLGVVFNTWMGWSGHVFTMVRHMVFGSVLVGMGVQNVFGAMLMAVALGNQTEAERVLDTPAAFPGNQPLRRAAGQ